MFKPFRKPSFPVLMSLSLFVTGCSGGNSSSPAYPVTGSVYVKGQPASYAILTFVPVDEAKIETDTAVATANENGEFSLWTREPNGKRRDGAKAGEYLVSVSWRIPDEPRSADTVYSKQLLPSKYLDPNTSGLKVEISPNQGLIDPLQIDP